MKIKNLWAKSRASLVRSDVRQGGNVWGSCKIGHLGSRADQWNQPALMNIINITWRALLTWKWLHRCVSETRTGECFQRTCQGTRCFCMFNQWFWQVIMLHHSPNAVWYFKRLYFTILNSTWMLSSQIKWNRWHAWKGLQAAHVKSSKLWPR